MGTAAFLLTALVALEHLYFMLVEMVWWKSRAHKIFPITQKFARQSAGLASNQGLYNGFLAGALLLGLFAGDSVALAFRFYGLTCAVLAGLWGGLTIQRRIFFVQSIPALAALAATCAWMWILK